MSATRILFACALGAAVGTITSIIVPTPYSLAATIAVSLIAGWFSGDLYNKLKEITNG